MAETAHIEFGIRRRIRGDRPIRTSFGTEFGDSSLETLAERQEGNAHTYYEGRLAEGTMAEVADALDQFAGALETNGAFTWDFHSGPFAGTAIVDQYLGQMERQNRVTYRMMMDITFGEGEVQRHDDREDIEEIESTGRGEWLGQSSVEGVDQAAVVEALRALSAQIRSGQIAVGEGQAAMELDPVRVSWAHVFIPDGSDKVELNLQWSNEPPPEPEAPPPVVGPRYYDDEASMSMTEFAEMLQRIATEILEDGTFMLEGEELAVGDRIGGEIGINPNGLLIDIGWRQR
jgi:hypothetical protein